MGVEIASAIPLSKVKFACRRSFHLTFRKLASNFKDFTVFVIFHGTAHLVQSWDQAELDTY